MFIILKKVLSSKDEILLERLVRHIAKKHAYPPSLELNDLLQVGRIAVFEKVKENYDPSKGKLISYAYPAIQRAIVREIKVARGKIQTTSFDQERGDANLTLHDVLKDSKQEKENQIQKIWDSELKNALRNSLSSLDAREANIISLRFGLVDGKERTLEEVGHMYKVTRERIRQIEAKALKRLRGPQKYKKLKGFLE